MKSSKVGLAFLVGALLSGCNSMEGTVTAYRSFQAVNKSNKIVTIPAGRYETKLKFHSSRDLRVKLRDVQGSTDQELKIRIPSGQSIPKDQGTFYLRASDSGQPFDISGSVDTNSDRTDSVSDRESCSETFTEYQCRYTPEYHCENVTITRPGYRDVAYHYVNTTRTIVINFGNSLGTFHGSDSSSSRVYDHYGSCNLH